MPLLKSLVCFKGYDNGRRFLAISLSCYALFLALSPVMGKAPVLLVLLLIVSTPILLATSFRRVHDGGLATPLAAIPVVTFWLVSIGIVYISHGSAWALMILAVLVTLGFTTLSQPGKRRQYTYTLGYSGPVLIEDKGERVSDNFQRIEPTIAGHHAESKDSIEIETTNDEFDLISHSVPPGSHASNERQDNGWEQAFQKWVIENKKSVALTSAILVILMFVIILWPHSDIEEEPRKEEQTQKSSAPKQRIAKVEMPDSFWIMLDENDALTVAWQGDIKSDGEVWSALTAKGDQSCVEISFNRQLKYRAMKVEVKNGGDYYADFSPVDTAAIVESIARRSSFKLCGYEFSLKGTQAKLMTNSKYRKILEAP